MLDAQWWNALDLVSIYCGGLSRLQLIICTAIECPNVAAYNGNDHLFDIESSLAQWLIVGSVSAALHLWTN